MLKIKGIVSSPLIAFLSLFIFCASIEGKVIANDTATGLIEITGTILDSISGERLDCIAIQEKGTTNGTITNGSGTFVLNVHPYSQLVMTCVGYREKTIHVGKNDRNLKIKLAPSDFELSEVVIKPKRERYRRKDNPSVILAKNIIAHKNDYNPDSHDYYSCERYDKMVYSINNFTEDVQKSWKKKFNFIESYIDTASITGAPILPISTDEKIETLYFRRNPQEQKTRIEASQHAGLDDMFPDDMVQIMKTEIFGEVNLLDDDIFLFSNKFVSPLSSFAPTFYKFYILDTLTFDDGLRYIDLGFAPVIPEAFGFIGHLYVTTDSTFFVKKAELTIPKDINLNFVRSVQIDLEFDRLADSTRICKRSMFDSEMNVTKNTVGIYAHRTCAYSNYNFEEPKNEDLQIFNQIAPILEAPEMANRDIDYWQAHREGRQYEEKKTVASMLTEMRNVPWFFYSEKILTMLFKGYVPIGNKPYEENKFLIGPLNTTISHNSFEGWRFRTGGITTATLNPHLFGFGYVAYGMKDVQYKYEGRLEYSFKPKKMHANEFPIHSLRLRYDYDTKLLGQGFGTSKDNFLLSIKRQDDDKITYERNLEFTYTREFWSGFSYYLQVNHSREYATRLTSFQTVGTEMYHQAYNMTTGIVNLRYAPNERFIQTRTSRIPVNKQTPIFSLTHTAAKSGFLDTDFNLQRTDFKFSKRFWLSAFGYVDAAVMAGKVWTQVPYTMLCLPNANLAYTIQPESFSQMNAMEFVNDQYAQWDLVYYLNGFVFNTIPLIQRLKWREVVSFRGLIGSLSDKNDPNAKNEDGSYRNPELYKFPTESQIFEMGKDPYMEFAVGIENIFKCIRVDYIRRLSYLDHEGINKNGVQVTMHWTF